MKSTAITNTAYAVGSSPFLRGGSATFVNFGEDAATLQGATTSGGSYSTLATIPAAGMIDVTDLPPFIKLSAAGTVYALAG